MHQSSFPLKTSRKSVDLTGQGRHAACLESVWHGFHTSSKPFLYFMAEGVRFSFMTLQATWTTAMSDAGPSASYPPGLIDMEDFDQIWRFRLHKLHPQSCRRSPLAFARQFSAQISTIQSRWCELCESFFSSFQHWLWQDWNRQGLMGFQPPPGLARPWPLRQCFPEHWFEFSMTSGRCEGSLSPLFEKRLCRYTKTGFSVNLLKIRSALLHFWNRTWRKKLRQFGNKFGESQTGRSIEVKSLNSFWGKARRPCQRLELRHPGHRSQQVTKVKI